MKEANHTALILLVRLLLKSLSKIRQNLRKHSIIARRFHPIIDSYRIVPNYIKQAEYKTFNSAFNSGIKIRDGIFIRGPF